MRQVNLASGMVGEQGAGFDQGACAVKTGGHQSHFRWSNIVLIMPSK